MYRDAVARMKDSSFICILQAQFLMYDMEKPLLARRALLLTGMRKPSLDEKFVIFKSTKHLEESAFQEEDIIGFVTGEKHLHLSRAYDKRCCVLLAEFWKGLGEAKVNVVYIRQLADQISESTSLATSSYSKLLKLRPNDASLLELYAGFILTVCNDPEEALKLQTKAKDIRLRAEKLRHSMKSLQLIDEESAILTVDASLGHSCGEITDTNLRVGRIFNQRSDFLIGRNVSSVLLPPFSTDFDGIVTRFLELGEESFFKTVYRSFFRTEQEFTLVPCYLELRHYTEDGMDYNIYVCIKERDDSKNFALVDPDTGSILGVGAHLAAKLESLGVETSAVFTIDALLPEYTEKRALWATPTGDWVDAGDEELDAGPHNSSATPDSIWDPSTKLKVESIVLHGPGSAPVDRLDFTFEASGLSLDVKIPQSIEQSNQRLGKKPMAKQGAQELPDGDYEAYPESPLPFDSLQQARLKSFSAPPVRAMERDDITSGGGRDSGDGYGYGDSEDDGKNAPKFKFSPGISPRISPELSAGGVDLSSREPGQTKSTPTKSDLSIVTNGEKLKSAMRQPSESPKNTDDSLKEPDTGVSFRARLGSFADTMIHDKMSIQQLPDLPQPEVSKVSVPDDGSVTEFEGGRAPSETSTTTSSNAVDIRRLLLRAKNGLDPDLKRFLKLYLYVMCVSAVMVIGLWVIRFFQLNEFQVKTSMTGVAGYRRYLAVTISYYAHSLVLMNKGVVLPGGLSEPIARKFLEKDADRLAEVSGSLFETRDVYGEELSTFYDERKVYLRSLMDGVEITEPHTIFTASILMAGQAKLLANTPLNMITANSSLVHYLVHNVKPADGPATSPAFFEALNRTTDLFSHQDNSIVSVINSAAAVLAASVVVVIAILLCVILVPMVRRIEENKFNVFHQLVTMPQHVFKEVGTIYEERLTTVHDFAGVPSDDESDPSDDDAASNGDTGSNDNPKATKRKKGRRPPSPTTPRSFMKGLGGIGKGLGQKLGLVSGKESKDVSSKDKRRTRRRENKFEAIDKELRASGKKCALALKMSVSLLLVMLYFTFSLFISFNMALNIADAPFVNNYAGLRRGESLLVMHKLRLYTTGGSRNGGFDVTKGEVLSDLNELESVHAGLIYGDKERELKGLLNRDILDESQHDLMFYHGCEGWKDIAVEAAEPYEEEGYEPEKCNEFMNGLVKDGVHGAAKKYFKEMRSMIKSPKIISGGGTTSHHLPGVGNSSLEQTSAADLSALLGGWKRYRDMANLETHFLQPAFTKSVQLSTASTVEIIDEAELLQIIGIVSFFLLLLTSFIVLVNPLVSSLDNEIKRTKSLLLMIPNEVMQTLPSLKRFLIKEYQSRGQKMARK